MNDKRLVEIRNIWNETLFLFSTSDSHSVKYTCCVKATEIIDEVFSNLNLKFSADDESIMIELIDSGGNLIRKADFENFGGLIMAMRGATLNNIKIEQEEYFELFELIGKNDEMQSFMKRFVEFKDRNITIN